jgi:Dam-replacing family
VTDILPRLRRQGERTSTICHRRSWELHGVQRDRMEAGIYFPLFIVIANLDRSVHAIYYLPADLQRPEMFQQRKPLPSTARRAGWVGYTLRLDLPEGHRPVRLV